MHETPQQPKEMGKAFLDLTHQGDTHWKKYLLSVLIILVVWALGSNIVLVGVYIHLADAFGIDVGQPMDGTNPYLDFITLNLVFVVILSGLWIAFKRAHKRPFQTLITPYKRIRWNRVFQGFGLQMALGFVATAIDMLLFPGSYSYALDPNQFYKFAILVLILTPFQAATEEFLARSYFLQIIGHFTRHPGALVIFNALPFMLLHFMNPEVAAHGAIPMLAFYFVVGAFLALVTLKDNGVELAIGIHAANNMFAAIFVNYKDSALPTNTVWRAETVNVWFGLIAYIVSAAIIYKIVFRNPTPESISIDSEPVSSISEPLHTGTSANSDEGESSR